MVASKEITLVIEGIKIIGQLYLPGEVAQSPFPTVCVCHGIPAHAPEPGDSGYPLLAETICQAGLAAFIFNFRGTGASGGNLDISGWTRDLKAVLDHLSTLPEVDKSRLSLFGFSGGAAVSVVVAAQDKRVSNVVACACPARFSFTELDEPQQLVEHFRSIGAIRDDNFPPSPSQWINGFQEVKPLNYVAELAPRPLLLVHGSEDDVVPVSQAYEMYEMAGEPKQLEIISGVGHRLRQEERAMAIAIDWLKSRKL